MDPEAVYDHNFLGHACNKNVFRDYDMLGYDRGIFAVGRHCLYKREMQDLSFEYVLKFFDSYKDQRKFLNLSNVSAHSWYEGNTEFVDEKLLAFLVEFEKRGHLKDTIIHFFSDHGDHVSPLVFTTSGGLEKYHPMSYMIIPEDVAP